MIKYFVLPVWIFILFSDVSPAQPLLAIPGDTAVISAEADRSLPMTVLNDLGILFTDGAGFFMAPLQFRTKDWYATGAVLGTTVGLMPLDPEFRKIALRNNGALSDREQVFDGAYWYGSVPTGWLFAGGLYASGLALDMSLDGWPFEKGEVRRLGRTVAVAAISSGTVVLLLRAIFGRERPDADSPNAHHQWNYDFLNTRDAENSLPSGHTTLAFALSTAMAEYINTWYARVVLYGAAALTGCQRWLDDRHWVSDIVLGAALGFAAGRYAVARERDRHTKKGTTEQPAFSIMASPRGLSMVVRF